MDVKAEIGRSQRELIDHLAKMEALTAELYEEYERLSPDGSDFWRALSREERCHERFLKSMHTLLDDGQLFYNLDKFDAQSLNARMAEVREHLAAVRREPISDFCSLETALSMEMSIADAHFFGVAKSYSPAFGIIAAHIDKDERLHIQRIQDRYSQLQQEKRGVRNAEALLQNEPTR